jgi:hypothetical protein
MAETREAAMAAFKAQWIERSARQGFVPAKPAVAVDQLDRLASLCERCHNSKTRSEQLGEKHWLTKGCDVSSTGIQVWY